MSNRKFESNYSKIQKKRRIKALIASQEGIMNKYITIDKKNELQKYLNLEESLKRDHLLDIGEFDLFS